jgi:cytochrome c-type biogenesis protein CcmH/NrfG
VSGRSRWLAIGGAVGLTALLGLYLAVAVRRAVALLGSGVAIGVVLGAATLVLPLLVVALLAREWWLAVVTQQMADHLAAEGGLQVDDLPRSPGGRIDRAAARQAFDAMRAQVEAGPDDWRSWFRLAFAYDAAGDRRRARESLRHAARLRRAAA